ncbi:hypothetical protein AC579_1185 [Pseudocercospora musae]|uniref:Uncharacterized protein n=1 Tax=Pseudocercospora musae TaxID=113226 RepID=A0A139HVN5_9PEZI|nr:hypothetical protein AC579_1185 [Pseudocercospora musae]
MQHRHFPPPLESPVSSRDDTSRDDMSYVDDQDSRYITTGTDRDIHPLLQAVGNTRKEPARLEQIFAEKT